MLEAAADLLRSSALTSLLENPLRDEAIAEGESTEESGLPRVVRNIVLEAWTKGRELGMRRLHRWHTFDEGSLKVWRPHNLTTPKGFPAFSAFDYRLEDILSARICELRRGKIFLDRG